MIKYYKPDNPDELLTIDGDADFICKKCGVIAIEVDDPKQVEINMYRREYLDCTKSLCELANRPYSGKLENYEYRQVVLSISDKPITGILTGFMVYYRTVLRELDGEKWFENISGM